MAFVKLDCAMLNSSIWPEKAQRDLFITALLMAEPHELQEETPQLYVNELKPTGWKVPPGWYGFVRAASVGIIHRAMVDRAEGLDAMERLGEPDNASKSKKHDGRRMVRIDGGFIILNFMDYRDRDHTAASRSKRWRQREKQKALEAEKAATREEAMAELERAKERANGKTIRPEHRDDGGDYMSEERLEQLRQMARETRDAAKFRNL